MPPRSSQVHDATAIIRARHRKQVRRRLIRVLVPILAVLLVTAVVWVIWFSPLFEAKSVEVTGNSQATTEEIVAAAQVPLGTPLARIDTDAIRARVREVPAVADASVSRNLTGVIEITVTERVGVYVISVASRYLLVDSTGTGFLTLDSQPEGLPVVTLTVDNTPGSQRLMADAATIVAALPDVVRTQMTWMGAQTPDTFTIDLADGREILWGSADQSDLKAQVIEGLLNVDAHYYDVSSPSHPATR